ncbi:hypothetical protein [Granulicella arctica]|uniref:hypothetical protein n=1 Tax=Granulicella arctica TaxID=940613 RepID=UPI0021E05063|nr:hypothetical protein [Granulicella arctica]
MSRWKVISALSAAALLAAVSTAPAQISINVGGGAPECPYGYYDYAPYNCSPYGYYGPDWFNGGLFIGAGPWYHGRGGFYGHVDNRYDPHHGYNGPFPNRGEQAFNHFHGNEAHDFQGHIGNAGHDAGNEHGGGFQGGGHPGGGGHR